MDEMREAVIGTRAPEMMTYTIRDFEQTFRMEYRGLGWYYKSDDTLLLLPTRTDNMIRVWHWPKCGLGADDPMNVYRWIVGAPVLIDGRK